MTVVARRRADRATHFAALPPATVLKAQRIGDQVRRRLAAQLKRLRSPAARKRAICAALSQLTSRIKRLMEPRRAQLTAQIRALEEELEKRPSGRPRKNKTAPGAVTVST